MSALPTRPILRYHGGKWRLAPWVISHFPAHRIYVEPFGGAASILLRKERSYAEVYNEFDGEIVNLFRVARERGAELRKQLSRTPYARREYRLSFEPSEDTLEQARRTVVRSFMGFGSNSLCRAVKSGFRGNSKCAGTTPSSNWRGYPDALPAIVERLQGVVIEHGDGLQIMAAQDSPETLHYCDPPYLHATRTAHAGKGARRGYPVEMTDAEHETLCFLLRTLSGRVCLSGYHSDLYDRIFAGWRRVERRTVADHQGERVEVLWMNYDEEGRRHGR